MDSKIKLACIALTGSIGTWDCPLRMCQSHCPDKSITVVGRKTEYKAWRSYFLADNPQNFLAVKRGVSHKESIGKGASLFFFPLIPVLFSSDFFPPACTLSHKTISDDRY